jgi:NAD(P)-dependent dehydrogenase (short-subunit alcohol dehydrogenase family)
MHLQQMFDVAGKSAIVTGAADGIGRAYAEVLSENGARVCLLDINRSGIDRTVAALRAAGGNAWGQCVDVTDRPAMAKAFDEVARQHGRIDIVFANAGIDRGRGI